MEETMKSWYKPRSRILMLSLVLALVAAACGDGNAGEELDETTTTESGTDAETTTTEPAESTPKIGFLIRFQGGTTYFEDMAAGAEAEAEALGIDLTVQFTDSSDEQLSALDTMIASGVDGVIITIQDPALGGTVVTKATDAGIALLASPDPFEGPDGEPVPVVTIDAKALGTDVGTDAARLYEESGWAEDTNSVVRVASIELPSLGTCNDRTDSATAAFEAGAPDFDPAAIVHLDYDGTLNSALDNMAAAVTNNSDATHWVIWSCNDEGVVGAIQALQNAGFAPDQLIGVGLGANLACDQWSSGEPSAYRSAIALRAQDNGAVAVRVMYEHLTDGVEFPAESIFPGVLVTPDTPEDELPC
jgi:L-arabinose transport system substrate-binding protein